jgi:hypothetical protein
MPPRLASCLGDDVDILFLRLLYSSLTVPCGHTYFYLGLGPHCFFFFFEKHHSQAHTFELYLLITLT